MKQYVALLLLALTALACTPSPKGWTLAWTEDFDGPTLQESTWTRVEKGTANWDDMMSLRSDLVRIEDGQLVLLGKVNDGTGEDTTPFVTGGIHSKGKKSFRMARVEIRAKFNSAQGFWPALWLMPDAEVPEPVYAELDIMEHLNHEDSVYQTVHSHYSLHVDGDNPPHYGMGAIDRDGWNVYAVEVYRDSICMYTNDIKTLTYPRVEGKDYQFPWPEYPFYLILSNQLGGNWVGNVDRPEELPSELRVDWIKVYQWKD